MRKHSGNIYTLTGNENIVSLIESMQASQYSKEIKDCRRFDLDKEYTELLEYLYSDNAKPIIASILEPSPHVLVIETAIKPFDLGDGIYAISCYDSMAPQLTNLPDNAIDYFSYERSFLHLNTNNGTYKYMYNGEADRWWPYYRGLWDSNIFFYDISELNDSFFTGEYGFDSDKETIIFEASDMQISSNLGNTMFEVKNNEVVSYTNTYEYRPYFGSGQQESSVVQGCVVFPENSNYNIEVNERASMVSISENYIFGFKAVEGLRLIVDSASDTMTIHNESNLSNADFSLIVQNNDGTIFMESKGQLQPNKMFKVNIVGAKDDMTFLAETNSDNMKIETSINAGGNIIAENFHRWYGGNSKVENSSNGESSILKPNVGISGSWILDHIGWWFKRSDGTWPANQWCYLPYNNTLDWYYFDEKGYMVTGWILDAGLWYYLNPVSDGTKGRMLTGWQFIDGKWYYFNEISDGTKGAMMTDTWIGEYYVNSEGVWEEDKKK